MQQKKILIVDDEQDLCDILLFNLHAAGYQADYALSAEEALTKDLPSYHLFLLDVMMTGMSGFDLAKALKAQPSIAQTPIIFLTAKDFLKISEKYQLFPIYIVREDEFDKEMIQELGDNRYIRTQA